MGKFTGTDTKLAKTKQKKSLAVSHLGYGVDVSEITPRTSRFGVGFLEWPALQAELMAENISKLVSLLCHRGLLGANRSKS